MDSSPDGRGWPAVAGQARGTKEISSFCTPHSPLRGTLSRRERDSPQNIIDAGCEPIAGQIRNKPHEPR
jgi:hypothetical protein